MNKITIHYEQDEQQMIFSCDFKDITLDQTINMVDCCGGIGKRCKLTQFPPTKTIRFEIFNPYNFKMIKGPDPNLKLVPPRKEKSNVQSKAKRHR